MNEEFPYNLPIWRRKYSAESPNKKINAEINPAYEISMGNPTYGTLILSNGINIGRCNPSFIWSNDSKCLAIPQYTTNWFFGFGKQRLLVIDVNENQGWQSQKLAYYIQPEKFESGKLTVTLKAKNATVYRHRQQYRSAFFRCDSCELSLRKPLIFQDNVNHNTVQPLVKFQTFSQFERKIFDLFLC